MDTMWADWRGLTKDYIIREGAETKTKIWLRGRMRLVEAGNHKGALGESRGAK